MMVSFMIENLYIALKETRANHIQEKTFLLAYIEEKTGINTERVEWRLPFIANMNPIFLLPFWNGSRRGL